MRKYFIVILLIITIGITAYDYYIKWQEKELTREIQEIYLTTKAREETQSKPAKDRFQELLRVNDEIVGWLSISNTNIDYPVVQTSNNQYYLTHNIKKENNKSGAIFLDFRNKTNELLSPNTIIYGHYMKNGTMFYDLGKYKDQQFYQENRILTFATLEDEMKWEVFSVYETDTAFNYLQDNFSTEQDYLDFIASIKNKSLYQNDINPSFDDSILTLSTCSYIYDDARLVIHARKVK